VSRFASRVPPVIARPGGLDGCPGAGLRVQSMAEKIQRPELARTMVTRRGMIANNIKAIGTVAASAVVARLSTTKASAHPVSCFLLGTKIQTVLGERSIEDLVIGDLLPTAFGGARPIQWIARYRRKKDDPSKPWMKHAQPVRIKRSALAPDVPHTDLYVTPRHALLIDGMLIPAGSLINGTTIALYAAEEYGELEFFHIKLETHDVIYAEGAPSETLLRVEETASNFADYLRNYGPPATQDILCAPLLLYGGARSEIKSRVRNVMSPWLGPQRVDIIRDRLQERAGSLTTELTT
jgi:hypothetical protein